MHSFCKASLRITSSKSGVQWSFTATANAARAVRGIRIILTRQQSYERLPLRLGNPPGGTRAARRHMADRECVLQTVLDGRRVGRGSGYGGWTLPSGVIVGLVNNYFLLPSPLALDEKWAFRGAVKCVWKVDLSTSFSFTGIFKRVVVEGGGAWYKARSLT